MKIAELTKYQKSRLCRCLFCGKEITEFQEFEFTTTKYKKFNIYTFIHSDCMVKAQEWLKVNKDGIEHILAEREGVLDDGK